jgi:hypothetical protein
MHTVHAGWRGQDIVTAHDHQDIAVAASDGVEGNGIILVPCPS